MNLKDIILKINKNKLKTIFIILFVSFIIWILIPVSTLNKDYSTVIVDKNNKILRVFLNKDEQWYLPPDKDLKIPDKLKTSILYFEDKYFYYHFGINPVSIFNSFFENLNKGYISRGGSTITMQVARVINPRNRTYINKIKEIFNSIKLELKYSKNEILNLYINNAPYGGNIVGYRAASLYYYQKSPEELTWSEACTLAVLPNSPSLISPVKNNQLLINKKNRLLKLLNDKNVIDNETYEISIKEPVPNIINKTPFLAPHLAQFLKDKYPEQKVIKTNIDFNYQNDIEKIVKNYSKHLKNKGIKNISVVVADTQTGKVETYIGSQDFFDIENKGQVNGVIAPRSTGSILKPFLYALSIDDGLLLPDTKIKDIPTYFGAFSPENSDKKYNGLISMKEALVRSLNVPAVLTLNEYGVYDFYSFLKKAGLSTLFRNSDEYGLTLILGGAEANLFEITSLYSSLGRLGKFTNLKIIPSEQNQEEKQLISEGASNLILNVLKDLKRPDAEYYWQQYENQFKLAWKTGTSFGNRDAWAVGVNPKWTVGVWVGNFTGETNANLAGATSAGSLMFDIFNYLPQKSKQKWFKNEFNNFEMTEICQDTGYKAGSSCTKKLIVEKPIAAKNIKICPYHKTIFVNNDEKYQVCSLCWNKDDLKKKNFLIYTPDTIDYLRKRGNIINNIPVHNPSCKSIQSKNLLKIIYPTNNSKILLPKDIGGVLQKINIKVAHLNENIKVYWYIDEKFLGQTQATHSKAIELKSGFHKISVIDENGNQDSCSIQIF